MNTRILDHDLNRFFVASAAIHCGRRGLTLHQLAEQVADRYFPGQVITWIEVRDAILERPGHRWRSVNPDLVNALLLILGPGRPLDAPQAHSTPRRDAGALDASAALSR